MDGEHFRQAIRVLNRALDKLHPSDQFNVCAFDHRQFDYQPSLVRANTEMIANCKIWITTHVPKMGGTFMSAAITHALTILEQQDLLPFIVLITDGVVEKWDSKMGLISTKGVLQNKTVSGHAQFFMNFFAEERINNKIVTEDNSKLKKITQNSDVEHLKQIPEDKEDITDNTEISTTEQEQIEMIPIEKKRVSYQPASVLGKTDFEDIESAFLNEREICAMIAQKKKR
eukprot:470477_1